MIYFISDIHADIRFKGLQEYLKTATDDDLLIVLGDVGLQFENTEENRAFTKAFLSSKKKIAFLDGNHENFAYLNGFPTEEWNGGKVHRLSENVVHLIRGNIYSIDGKNFFVFGGCKSSEKWAKMGLWFDGETASEQERKFAENNLLSHKLCVDYILTHKLETDGAHPHLDENLYLLHTFIRGFVSYRKWYFGHLHSKLVLDEKHACIYDDLVLLDE